MAAIRTDIVASVDTEIGHVIEIDLSAWAGSNNYRISHFRYPDHSGKNCLPRSAVCCPLLLTETAAAGTVFAETGRIVVAVPSGCWHW